jgi:hypothetical protein
VEVEAVTALHFFTCDQCGQHSAPTPAYETWEPIGWSTLPAGFCVQAYGGGSSLLTARPMHFCTAECCRIYLVTAIEQVINPGRDPSLEDE